MRVPPVVSGLELEGSTIHHAAMGNEGSSVDPEVCLSPPFLLSLHCLWSFSENKIIVFIDTVQCAKPKLLYAVVTVLQINGLT